MALDIEQLRQDVADVLGEEPGEIPVDENLLDYGLDSIRIMTLVGRWKQRDGIEASVPELYEEPVITAWAEHLG